MKAIITLVALVSLVGCAAQPVPMLKPDQQIVITSQRSAFETFDATRRPGSSTVYYSEYRK